MVQIFQFIPEIFVEIFQTEVGLFLKIMEESFLKDPDSVFYGTLELGFLNLRG